MPAEVRLDDPVELQKAIDKHGSIDAAAKALGVSRDSFRKACKDAGISVRRAPRSTTKQAAFVGEPVSKQELLEAEVAELRRRLQKARKAEIANEQLAQILTEIVPEKAPIYRPAEYASAEKSGTEHVFALDWSDLHAAEVVDSEQMNGINSYDWDEMLLRHDRMLQSIVSFKEKRPYPVDTLYINGLGDMLSGNNHPELKETNSRPIMEAALQLGLDMAEWVEALHGWFGRIVVNGVVGNHPRTTVKPAMKNRYDNFDWMVYQIMRLRLAAYAGIEVNVPKSAHIPVKILGETHLLFHGDGIRSTMPGVPWGGVMRRVAELQNQYTRSGIRIDRFHLGHFHEANVVRGGRIIMNGSVKGPDEYSILQFGGGSDAQQLLQVYHPRRGLTETCFLDLQVTNQTKER